MNQDLMSIEFIKNVIQKLEDIDQNVRMAALNCLNMLCVHCKIHNNAMGPDTEKHLDDIWTKFISINGVQKIIEKIQDSDLNVQQATLDCIKILCAQGIIFYDLNTSYFYKISDNIRNVFILKNGVEKVMEKFQDSDRSMRQTALDCIKVLCDQGIIFFNFTPSTFHWLSDDIRTTFISAHGIQKLIDKLHDTDKYVRKTALDCIKKLCVQGMIFCDLTASHFY
jgi:vesicle coat complex subunit